MSSEKPHAFWGTQPVPQTETDRLQGASGPVDKLKVPADVRQEPYKLPDGFEWYCIDVDNESELTQVYQLLALNYVEDDENMFRFEYSAKFLHWALTPPHCRRDWHLAVRATKNQKLLAFISAVPATVVVHGEKTSMVEINFLCVHKKLRSRRLAPVLIKEITRRVNLTDRWQAVYTAGSVLPTPVATCRYYHRSLNPKKLIESKFSPLGHNMTISRAVQLYRVKPETTTPGLRPMTRADVPSACALLVEHLKQFKIYVDFSDEEDFAHWLLPRDGVIYSYVATDKSGKVTDLISFYSIPSTIIDHPKYDTLYAAYSFYNVSTTQSQKTLMDDALLLAKQKDFDVFNALDLLNNGEYLKDLKFGLGDGNLHYYLYNWRCPEIAPADVGIVML